MRTDLVTINYYSTELINRLEHIVNSIENATLFVVDNSDNFTRSYNTTKVLSAGGNVGFGRACNFAAERSEADILLFVNPDLSLTLSALQSLLDQAPRNKSTIWGPTILDRHGKTSALMTKDRGLIRYRRIAHDPIQSENPMPQLYISGACLCIFRSFFNDLGGFNPDVFMYAEDMDLCLKAKSAKGTVCCLPNIYVHHEGGRSSSKFLSKFLRYFRSFNGHYKVLITRHPRLISLINAAYLAAGFRTVVG